MTERFTISDTHFGHEKCCTVFKREDGSPLRPFASADEMDEAIVQNWNAKIGPKDKIYHLGDVAIARRSLKTLARLNGRKVLVRGNHDVWKLADLTPYFEDVVGVQVFVDDFIMSHVPLHPDDITSRFKANVHGHRHAGRVTWKIEDISLYDHPSMMLLPGDWKPKMIEVIDPRYLCVSVEHTDYAPLSFDEVRARIAEQQT